MPPVDRPFTVMGIDPGTSTLGVSVITWDLQAPRYTVDFAFTLKATDNTQGYHYVEELHGNRTARLQQHHDEILQWLHQIRPHAVIAESPFQGRFAQSFAALTECIAVIRQAVMRYDMHMPLNLVDPPTVKRAAGVKLGRKTDKEDVRRALAIRSDLTWGMDLGCLDEHSVDAIAVGLHYYQSLI